MFIFFGESRILDFFFLLLRIIVNGNIIYKEQFRLSVCLSVNLCVCQVRASTSQSVDLGFISLVESYQKTLKNGFHSFRAWRSAHKG